MDGMTDRGNYIQASWKDTDCHDLNTIRQQSEWRWNEQKIWKSHMGGWVHYTSAAKRTRCYEKDNKKKDRGREDKDNRVKYKKYQIRSCSVVYFFGTVQKIVSVGLFSRRTKKLQLITHTWRPCGFTETIIDGLWEVGVVTGWRCACKDHVHQNQ